MIANGFVDQENPPHSPTIRELAGGGYFSVLWIMDLTDAYEIGLGDHW